MLSNDLAALYTRVYTIHPSLRLVPTTVGNRDSVEMPYSQRLPPVKLVQFALPTARSLKEPMAFSRSISGFQLAAIRDAELDLSDPDT
jgi:hypothetical protein